MHSNRREFLTRAGLYAAGGLLFVGSGCGGDDDGRGGNDAGSRDSGPSDAGPADASTSMDAGASAACNSAIGTNHGHVLTVPESDVAAGVEKTYDIRGSSGHPHSVTLTPESYGQLAAGETVVITSTEGGSHTHLVTLTCA